MSVSASMRRRASDRAASPVRLTRGTSPRHGSGAVGTEAAPVGITDSSVRRERDRDRVSPAARRIDPASGAIMAQQWEDVFARMKQQIHRLGTQVNQLE